MDTYSVGDVAGSLKCKISKSNSSSKLSLLFGGVKENSFTWQKVPSTSSKNTGNSGDKQVLSRKRKSSETNDESNFVKKKRKRVKDKKENEETIFIGNLPIEITKERIRKLFKKYGSIRNIRFRGTPPENNSHTDEKNNTERKKVFPRPNKNAFVRYSTKEAASTALELNGHLVDGFHIRVDLACNDKVHDHTRSIFIGNLPFNVTDNAVYDHFNDCGEIENVRVVRDAQTRIGKGFGYVTFKSTDCVTLALRLNNSNLSGREIRIKRALKKIKQTSKPVAARKFQKSNNQKDESKTKSSTQNFQGLTAKPRDKKKAKKKHIKRKR